MSKLFRVSFKNSTRVCISWEEKQRVTEKYIEVDCQERPEEQRIDLRDSQQSSSRQSKAEVIKEKVIHNISQLPDNLHWPRGSFCSPLWTWKWCSHHRLIHIDWLRCQPAEAKRKGTTAMLLGSPAGEGRPRTVHTAMWCRLTETDLSSSPLRVFPLIKAVAHAYCKIRMHHIVKQRNILVSGKMSGKQCQSWFYLDINDNLRSQVLCSVCVVIK